MAKLSTLNNDVGRKESAFWLKFVVIVGIIFYLIPNGASAAPEFKGMSYVGWGAETYQSTQSEAAIKEMRELGVDMVALNVFWFQETVHSEGIYPDYYAYSATLESLAQAISQIQGQGMKVLLKPNLDIRYLGKGEWRGMIEPDNPEAWFASYELYILSMARLAERQGVAMLSIGTELNGVEKHEEEWRALIAKVRRIYHGRLIYAANYTSVGKLGGGYQTVPFWDALDYIGIDAYYPLTYKLDPEVGELAQAWQNIGREISVWRDQTERPQTVIFTEVGFRSINRATTYPWDYSTDGVLDLKEQADAYQSLLITGQDWDWWGGAMWWYWPVEAASGGKYNRGFTPQSKPAGEILREYYRDRVPLETTAQFNQGMMINDWGLLVAALVGKYLPSLVGFKNRWRQEC